MMIVSAENYTDWWRFLILGYVTCRQLESYAEMNLLSSASVPNQSTSPIVAAHDSKGEISIRFGSKSARQDDLDFLAVVRVLERVFPNYMITPNPGMSHLAIGDSECVHTFQVRADDGSIGALFSLHFRGEFPASSWNALLEVAAPYRLRAALYSARDAGNSCISMCLQSLNQTVRLKAISGDGGLYEISALPVGERIALLGYVEFFLGDFAAALGGNSIRLQLPSAGLALVVENDCTKSCPEAAVFTIDRNGAVEISNTFGTTGNFCA